MQHKNLIDASTKALAALLENQDETAIALYYALKDNGENVRRFEKAIETLEGDEE